MGRLTNVVFCLLTVVFANTLELASFKIKAAQIVQFVSQFVDTTKHVHLVSEDNGSVTAALSWDEVTLVALNLAPLARVHVKAPNIVQFLVVILLSAEHNEHVFV